MTTKRNEGEKFLPFINRWLYENLGLHKHTWEEWSEAKTSAVYNPGTTQDDIKNAIPLRHELKQRRACFLCKLLESRTIAL